MQHDFVDFQKTKNDLLRIICHELRTPVSAVIGFTEILRENLNSEDKIKILDTMSVASKKIWDLSDTALMVSQIDQENINESMRPTKITSIVEYAISDVNEEYTGKFINISVPPTSDTTEIIIEPDLIKEVIKIFLSNAFSSSLPHSTVSLRITENEDTIVLTIIYSGQGDARDESKKLTDLLASELNIQHSDWPSLRLAMARYIMDLHNAEIKIIENTGSGAQVNMIFPINKAKQNALNQILSQLN